MNEQLPPDIKFQLVRKIETHKVIGLASTELLEHEAKYLEFHRLSGVILFQRNIESLPQVADLIGSVEERLGQDGLLPLVMADHEGDFVSELQRVIGAPPSAMAIASTGDRSLARDVAKATGEAMAKLGVNVVLAPVADLYLDAESPVTGLRTFGRDPEAVGEYVAQTIEGFHEAGILTCAKHFPGHGATHEDSHETLPEIRRDMEAVRAVDLPPFEAAISAGADMVMTAHVTLSGDGKPRPPASFDPQLIKQELRERMGFEGVVITDALEMEGARAHARETYGGLTGGFERALLAGTDLLLYSAFIPERMSLQEDDEPMIAVEVMQTIIDTLERVVDRERIESKLADAAKDNEGIRNLLDILGRSEQRIAALRERVGEMRQPPQAADPGNVIQFNNYASTPAIYKTVAEQSIVLLRDPDAFVPGGAGEHVFLLPMVGETGRFLKAQSIPLFLDGLCRRFDNWQVTRPVTGFEADATGALHPAFAPRDATDDAESPIRKEWSELPDHVLPVPVLSFRGLPPEEFRQSLCDFIAQGRVPMVIVTGWPKVDWLPDEVGVLLTFGASQQVAAAAGAILAGQNEAVGTWEITS